MDVLRRDTDYALRAVVRLAEAGNGRAVSTRAVAEAEAIPYQLGCKLMQKLAKAGIVASSMGPAGGFTLCKKPQDINLLDIVEAIQGPLSLNRCVLGAVCCPVGEKCAISTRLKQLQGQINEYLAGVTLADLVQNRVETETSQTPEPAEMKEGEQ